MSTGLTFEIQHTFDCTLDVLEGALFGADLLTFLATTMTSMLRIQPVLIEDNGEVIHRRVEYHAEPQIERLGLWRIPEQWHAWVEESTYDRRTRTLHYRNIPLTGRLKGLLLNEGTVTFQERDGKIVRTLRGELRVRARLLSRMAERLIYSQAMRLLDEEARATQLYLRSLGAEQPG